MPYKITEYTKLMAKELGVTVKKSTVKGKKIDVFKAGVKIASIGAVGYNDFPTLLEKERLGKVEKGAADRRRKLYKIRHELNRHKVGTPGYYADKLLW
jgi:hypothetical protein